ncbi:hypothetical protein G443_000204 [Actinoalloteichus cyanogriseus DSM 43889]|uniref:Uncharacterized protein n=1 Tax=Actinoalloteichus caeruleus DSM 43889 TaxID=1120930 RepID=A0ABT1JBR7_ACTCY|nr:hypothetical protein [Actinoalloteichus caeruleus DSM 43889]
MHLRWHHGCASSWMTVGLACEQVNATRGELHTLNLRSTLVGVLGGRNSRGTMITRLTEQASFSGIDPAVAALAVRGG